MSDKVSIVVNRTKADGYDIDNIKRIFSAIEYQYEKYGDQHHTPEQWKAIFEEEYAEGKCDLIMGLKDKGINELVQSCAVICAWIRDIKVSKDWRE